MLTDYTAVVDTYLYMQLLAASNKWFYYSVTDGLGFISAYSANSQVSYKYTGSLYLSLTPKFKT